MADDNQFTICRHIVSAGKPSLTLLYLLVTAVSKKDYAMLALLLAYGAKVEYTRRRRFAGRRFEVGFCLRSHIGNALTSLYPLRPKQQYYIENTSYLQRLHLPVEVAIANLDDVVYTLIELGAHIRRRRPAIPAIEQQRDFSASSRHDSPCWQLMERLPRLSVLGATTLGESFEDFGCPERAPQAAYSRCPTTRGPAEDDVDQIALQDPIPDPQATMLHGTSPVLLHLKVFYDELYEICWQGNDKRIEELCLPKEEVDGQEPVQITVQTASPFALSDTGKSSSYRYRHFELMATQAFAQYKAPEMTAGPFNTDTFVGRKCCH
ncbi:hypothetical protein OF83DRAFT_1171479 [Amylostereum chailletii]|nr:hypothetical protein OF83DRAFT_1171479 [Amylostereum chailletii]